MIDSSPNKITKRMYNTGTPHYTQPTHTPPSYEALGPFPSSNPCALVGVGGNANVPPIGLHPSSPLSSARIRLAMLAVCLWLFFAGDARQSAFMSGTADPVHQARPVSGA